MQNLWFRDIRKEVRCQIFNIILVQKYLFENYYRDCSNYFNLLQNKVAWGVELIFLSMCSAKTFINLLVQKYWLDLNIIGHKCSMGDSLPRLFKLFQSIEKHSHQGTELVFLICICCESLKNLLVPKYWLDLKIILQKCTLSLLYVYIVTKIIF